MQFFRLISLLEGISYLVILGVTLGFISRDYVSPLGMTHGILFIIYVVFSVYLSYKKSWSMLVWLAIFVASLVPFAFIGVEIYLKKSTTQRSAIC